MTKEAFLEAARLIRVGASRLRSDEESPHRYWSPPSERPMPPSQGVADAARFVYGGGEELPLHRDMQTRLFDAKDCAERAAQVCESLAYDGTDGP